MSFQSPQATFRTSAGLPSGRLGLWWLLASEIVIFGGLLTVYIMSRMTHPEWGQEAGKTGIS